MDVVGIRMALLREAMQDERLEVKDHRLFGIPTNGIRSRIEVSIDDPEIGIPDVFG